MIAGLGNPGSLYENTRHNLGFRVIDAFAKKISNSSWKKDSRSKAEMIQSHFCSKSLILVKPMQYMNCSGESIVSLCRYYQICAKNLLVIYDDVDLELGRIKITMDKNAGGHNGIKNIFSHYGEIFTRYRLGIGSKNVKTLPILRKDFVLGSFSKDENEIIEEKMNEILAGLELIIKDGPVLAMNTLNRRLKNYESQTKKI